MLKLPSTAVKCAMEIQRRLIGRQHCYSDNICALFKQGFEFAASMNTFYAAV